jgi:hypothetical protein
MTIMNEPLPLPAGINQFVDPDTGILTTFGVLMLSEWRDFISGMGRVIPCEASGTNIISLTPFTSAPKPKRYNSHDIFVAKAAGSSSGLVTATVVPEKGTLDTLKVYKTAGAAQATTGDVVADSLYLFVYADYLDGGAGGFVLK